MKSWFVAVPIALAAPVAAAAQTSAEDARAADLACQLAGLCGELAAEEADREKQGIEGVDSRGLPSLGKLMAASKASSSRAKATTSRAAAPAASAPAKAQITRSRTISRQAAPAPTVGRAAPIANARVADPASGAADVPASLARRAPLFVTFGLNSAKLTKDSTAEVKSFAKALADISAAGMDKRYRIEGHTDATGDATFNRRLSEERAAAVREALLAAGVDGSRIEVAGYGSDQPIEGINKTNPLNRRVEAVEIE